MLRKIELMDSLRKKLLLVSLLLWSGMAAGVFVILRLFVIPVFVEFEYAQSQAGINRVESAVHAEMQRLSLVSLEYANWDPIHENIQHTDIFPGYIEEFMDVRYWSEIEVAMMLFINRDGKLVWGKLIKPPEKTQLSSINEMIELPDKNHPLISHDSVNDQVQGLLPTRLGIMLLASHPISRTDGSGPVMGTVIVGRLIDESFIAALEKISSVKIDFLPYSNSSPQSFRDNLRNSDNAPNDSIVTQTSDEITISRKLLTDIFGLPLTLLETRTPSRISTIGTHTVRVALLLIFIAIGLFFLSSWWILGRIIVTPLTKLKRHIAHVRTTGVLNAPFDSNRRDEFGILCQEFNALTSDLAQTQQQRDEAESLSQTKSLFLASISHEIRTPMNGVIGMTDALHRTNLSPHQSGLVTHIKSSGELLLSVINDILDFSKISAGPIFLEKRTFSLLNMIEDVNAVIAGSAKNKSLEFLCIYDENLPTFVRGDEQRIKQVLINLLGNAIKFTPSGEVCLSLTSLKNQHATNDSRLKLSFRISDTGIGIPKEAIKKIFESFSQADSGTTRQYGGTGLGLTISNDLVEAMGGKIEVSSVDGKGSEFHVVLPIDVPRGAGASGEASQQNFSGVRVLLVDDNLTSLKQLRQQFQNWGALVKTVSSGNEALDFLRLEAAENCFYNLLVIDRHMPTMNGLELANAIASRPLYGAPGIILLSSVTDESTPAELSAQGVNSVLAKPVMPHSLFQHAHAILDCASNHPEDKVSEKDRGEKSTIGSAMFFNAEVLVAEDNAVNQQVILIQLEELGAQAVVIDDGEQALEALHTNTFDLVIMDCHMPRKDGYATTKTIREMSLLANNGNPLPILAMTAGARSEDRDKCFRAGMDAYISKPYSYEELIHELHELLPQNWEPSFEQSTLNALEQHKLNGESILNDLIDMYVENSSQLIDALQQAILGKDPKELQHHAHSLKSSSATLGLMKVSELCRRLEILGKDAQLDATDRILNLLRAELSVACSKLLSLKSDHTELHP